MVEPTAFPSREASGFHEEARLFKSFWIAGYEGADHLNSAGQPLSMMDANQHGARLDEDYALLRQFNIRTVRESIGWRITERDGEQGFARLRQRAEIARKHGIEVIWSLMHYGWPEDIDIFSKHFVERFGDFSASVARTLRDVEGLEGQRFYQPVNEISFLTWALSATGLMNHPISCPGENRGAQAAAIKRQLVRAAIRACDVIGALDPGARFMHSDPLMHVVVPHDANDQLRQLAAQARHDAFEAWDMLSGRTEPELGGSARHLDIIGVNYYHNNQSEIGSNALLYWHLGNPRRKPFNQLLGEVWQRYQRPLMIAETSHVGDGRAQWLDYIGHEMTLCLQAGLPLEGVCLYPAIDRPSWDDFGHWHHSGLWDVDSAPGRGRAIASFDRALCLPYARRLKHWQQRLPAPIDSSQGAHQPLDSATPLQGSHACHSIHKPGEPVVPTIIVFSHLRWSFVYQRPQHLLSRLAKDYRIVFMEEPVPDAAHDHLEQLSPSDNVEVLRPHLTGNVGGFHDDLLPRLQSQLATFLKSSGIDDYLVWFYTPMALPLASGLSPRAIIYDCMDELSAFRNAPRQLVQRENALYQQADLVLTGGPSLYRSKLERHHNVHCFSSSVDAEHFAPVAGELDDHPAQAALARPRLGYCGVIDERVDVELIGALADAHPEWQMVMVGPVVKIPYESLPQRPNIHWLGQRGYTDLPRFMAGWDVCLLPFALNESTKFISPTKTLEYMAAGKPAVSTRIRDVADPYGHVVHIADSHQEFIAGCEGMLCATPEEQATRAGAMQEILAGTSWDRTASAIRVLIEQELTRSGTDEAANSGFGLRPYGQKPAPSMVRADLGWKQMGRKLPAQAHEIPATSAHAGQHPQRASKAYKPAA